MSWWTRKQQEETMRGLSPGAQAEGLGPIETCAQVEEAGGLGVSLTLGAERKANDHTWNSCLRVPGGSAWTVSSDGVVWGTVSSGGSGAG